MNENHRIAIERKKIANDSIYQRCEFRDCANKACCVSFRGNAIIYLCVIHGSMAEKDQTEKVVWARRSNG